MAEPLTLYKLIVLYILNKVNFSMTNDQLSEFILTQGYTDYFKFQQTMSELLSAKLVEAKTVRNNTYYMITQAGSETCTYFQGRISKPIRDDIHKYLRENEYELREEVSVLADYYRTGGEYEAVLCIREQGQELLHLKLRVPGEAQADLMCRRFEEKSKSIYAYLMKQLLTGRGKKG